MRKISTITIIVSVLVIAILLGAYGLSVYASIASAPPTWSCSSSNMMGSTMMNQNSNSNTQSMMNGMMNAQVSSIDNATFSSEYSSPPNAVTVNTVTNTITITNSGTTTLPVEAAPLWYPRAGDYWLIYGLVNPTIEVKQGATVNFLFVSMDNETHMPAITTIAPPYQEMPMMQGSGMQNMMMSGMMGQGANSNVMNQVDAEWPAIGPMLPGVAPANGASSNPVYSDVSLSVTFNTTGSFWYLCLNPGHAQMGMYGEISVVPS